MQYLLEKPSGKRVAVTEWQWAYDNKTKTYRCIIREPALVIYRMEES